MNKIYCANKYFATITEYILVKKTQKTVTVKPYEDAPIHIEKIQSTFTSWFNTFDEAKQYLILYYNEEIHYNSNLIKSNVEKLKSTMNLEKKDYAKKDS